MPSERVQRRIEERLDRADAAIDGDDWATVRELAQDVLDLDADNMLETRIKTILLRQLARPDKMARLLKGTLSG